METRPRYLDEKITIMSKIESRIGKIEHVDERVFGFLSDFDNYKQLIPEDRVKNFTSDGDSCSFSVEGLGSANLRIIEKEPYKLIKIVSESGTPVSFTLWIQMKGMADYDTRVKITVEPKVNKIMMGMVKKPLQNFVNTIVDQLEQIPF